jgi:PAS domain S-box-containing protein
MALKHVKVPKEFEPIFAKAQKFVNKYFSDRKEDPSKATVEISGERYLLVRGASMSVDFFETVKDLYKDVGEEKALNVARSLLFDIAHAIGKADARDFHKKMNLTDPVEKLSAGPIHFAHSGWAFVDIFPESKPSPDENYYLIYDHPFSFESAAWEKAGKKSDCPVCVMNAGYSSGWCEESFGITLVASEIMCKAKGDEACRFIMAHPSHIDRFIKAYLKKEPKLAKRITKYEIPGFFRRKQVEISLRESEEKYRRIFEHSNDAIFIHDFEGHIQDVNSQACVMLGCERKDILATPIAQLHAEESLESSVRAFKEVKEKDATRFESKFKRCDGMIIDVEISSRLVDPERGIIQGIVRDITDRKRVERELIEKEREIRLVAESSVDMIFILNKSGRFLYASPSSKDLLSYEPEEIVGNVFTKYIPESELSNCWTKLGEIFLHNKINSFDTIAITKDDRLVPVEINGRLTEYQGQLVAQGTMRDVTERMRAEKAIKESEVRYRDLLNNVPCMVYRGKRDWSVETIGPYVREITGHDSDEFERGSVNWQDLIHDEDKDRVLEESGTIVFKPKSLEQEYRIVGKDGRITWVRDIKKSLFQDGEFAGVDGFVVDITERKKTEEALRVREEELRLIFENAKDAIFWADPQTGKIINCNKAAEKLLERNRDEIIGSHQTSLHPPEEAEHYADVFREHFKSKGAIDIEAEAITNSGKRIPVDITASVTTVGGKTIVQGVFHDITERKKAAAKIAESEKKYRAIFETSPEAIVLLDTKGYVLDVNDRVIETLGFSPDEIRGEHLLEMPTLTKESRIKGLEVMRERLKGKEIPPYELDFITRKGEKRIGLIRAQALKDESGEVVADLVMISDITEQKKAEQELKTAHDEMENRVKDRTRELSEANTKLKHEMAERMKVEEELRKSEHLYQTLAETAKDFIFIVDKDFKIQYANKYATHALGREKEGIVDVPLVELFPGKEAERMVENLRRVFATGVPLSAENLFSFPEYEFWLHTILVPLRDEKGVATSVMGLSRNTTDRRKAEEALRESEARYRGLFEDSPISLWEEDYSDLEKYLEELRSLGVEDFKSYFGAHPEDVKKCATLVNIVDVNRTTVEMYEAGSKEELVKGLDKVFTEESYRTFRDGLIVFTEGGMEFEGEATNKTLSGKRMDISIKWAVAPGFEETMSKVLVSIIDITERKRLENEVRQALKFKSDFMATMSHELRTPLNSIIGCADLLLKDDKLELPERRVNNLKSILGSSDRLISMINNILDMARLEAGRAPLRAERFSLGDAMKTAVEYCSGLIGEKELEVVEDIATDIPELNTDREKLTHVITNLLGNAIKFTDAGKIVVSAKVSKEDRDYVMITVKDPGAGIAEGKMDMIFEQFKQIDVSTTRRHGGIGLGLAIVKAYSDLLGGKVGVQSKLGQGSTFTITLPINLPDEELEA